MKPVSLTHEDLYNIDIGRFAPYVPSKYLPFFFGEPGIAPYRLLAYLSTIFNNTTITEIGVHNGWGSLALSFNPTNHIVGYDIDLSSLSPAIKGLSPRLEFRTGLAHEVDPEGLLSSPLVHLDAQHDGIYEQVLFNFLVARGYRGWLLLDDIHLNPQMEAFWRRITLSKHDLTSFGHNTGTGLVRFNEQVSHI